VEAAASFLKTAGVLLALWLILLGVGFGLGAIPPGAASSSEAEAGDADAAEEPDADAPDGGVETALEAADPDAGPTAPPATELPTRAVCQEPGVAPSLSVLALGAVPTIAVGCGDRWELIAGAPLSRVARILTPPGEDEALAARAGAAATLDFDGDGSADLALPFARYGAGGATSGGGLYVVRRSGWNLLGEVRPIAPIAAAAVAVGAIDGVSGDDLVGVNQANPFARLASEGWVFSGGASPRRSAVVRAATGSTAAALVDLDVDGSMDVALASTDDGRLDVFFGDGAGRFPRHRTFDVASAAGLSVADLDGDAKPDLAIEGAQPGIVLAGAEASLNVAPLPGALRGLVAQDLDGDGRPELVGFEPPALVALHRGDDGSWERRVVLELSGPSFGVRRHAFADVDGDGTAEVILLGTRSEEGMRMLELMIVPSTLRGVVAPRGDDPIHDAAWMIEVPLPEAQPL
jgi:hypothetical protein